jgi:hypothetical protein
MAGCSHGAAQISLREREEYVLKSRLARGELPDFRSLGNQTIHEVLPAYAGRRDGADVIASKTDPEDALHVMQRIQTTLQRMRENLPNLTRDNPFF